MSLLRSWFDRRASQSTSPPKAKSPDTLPHSQSEGPATPHTVDGVVEIRDGRVSVTDLRGLGRFPTFAPGRDVVVFVDGKIIDRPTLVASRSSVEVHTPPHPPTRRMSLRLSDSELEAQLIVEWGKGKEFRIAPSPRAKGQGWACPFAAGLSRNTAAPWHSPRKWEAGPQSRSSCR